MSKIFHPTEDRLISEEEAQKISEEAFREMEKAAKQKAPDDYSFDDLFNGYIEGVHYVAENGYVMFIKFEYELDSLYRYYQYTKRFIASFEKATEECVREHEEEGYGELDIAPGELTKINFQSILLMAYTAFESFLRDFIEVIDEKAGVLRRPYDDTTTLKYLQFLHYEKSIFVPSKLFHKYNEVRLVRNYFAHSLDEPQVKLVSYLEDDPCGILSKNKKYLLLNERYMEFAFGTLGKMVKAIEGAFEKYYPDIQ